MARRKPDAIVTCKDLGSVNAALAEIARIKRDLNRIEDNMNAAIEDAKKAAALAAEPLKARIAAIEAGITVFAEFRKKDLFADRRSRDLDHGRLGFRRTSELKTKPKITWAMVLERLKDLQFTEAIRVKHSVDKDALRGWPDEKLDMVGVRRQQRDQFWYETGEEALADTLA